MDTKQYFEKEHGNKVLQDSTLNLVLEQGLTFKFT